MNASTRFRRHLPERLPLWLALLVGAAACSDKANDCQYNLSCGNFDAGVGGKASSNAGTGGHTTTATGSATVGGTTGIGGVVTGGNSSIGGLGTGGIPSACAPGCRATANSPFYEIAPSYPSATRCARTFSYDP